MARKRQDGLGLIDRLVIVVAWLATCGVVFVLGYYVGKESVPRRAGVLGGPVEIHIEAPVRTTGPEEGGPDFYEYLDRQATGGRAAVAAPRRATTTTRPRPTSPIGRVPATVRRPPPPRPSTTRPPPKPSPPARTAPPTLPDVGGRRWNVFVSPTRSRLEAEEQRSRLRSGGYDASVVRMQRDGDTWYRVRVGRYGSQAKAEEVRRQLRDRGVGHAFVQSE
jgi:cell division protein FtsN